MPFDVTLWPARGEDSIGFADVDYVSLTNSGTYGKPPLIAPSEPLDRGRSSPVASSGDTILYVNPEHYVAIDIEVK